jgi:hypothetical protein
MDTKTGNIYEIKTTDEQWRIENALGRKLMPLSDKEAAELKGMNRHERRKWAAQRRSDARAEAKRRARSTP